MADPLRVLFLGMAGHFSLPPLQALLEAGVEVCGVVLPGNGFREVEPPAPVGLPILGPYLERNIVHLAWECHVPVFEGLDLRLGQLRPDVLAVACFPRLIPRQIRALARLAAVNIHPSLLPENRGPAPLYWTLRLGAASTGVTVHLLDDRADAGDILAQREIAVPPGITETELERECAHLGGDLLVDVLRRRAFRGTPQDESRATYYPWPASYSHPGSPAKDQPSA